MTYRGHIESGKVVFDEPTPFAEGTPVRVEIVAEEYGARGEVGALSLADELVNVIGKAEGLPTDSAESHDKYLREEHST